eukprot:2705027-Prymnesium_polylepis.2
MSIDSASCEPCAAENLPSPPVERVHTRVNRDLARIRSPTVRLPVHRCTRCSGSAFRCRPAPLAPWPSRHNVCRVIPDP